jgi:DNA replication protein DnaC
MTLSEEERHLRRIARVEAEAQRFQETLPAAFINAAADHPEPVLWLAHQRAQAEKDYPIGPEGLLLTGEPGRGKTWQMFGIGRVLAAEGYRVVWENVARLIDSLKPGRSRDCPGGMDDLYRADLLLLDDLSAHRHTPFAEAILDDLIDYRWSEQRPCIITTNIPPGKLSEALGLRIASRLNGMCRPVHIDGPDRRRP